MAEVAGQGPLDLFQAGEAELVRKAGDYRQAQEHQRTVEAEFRAATAKTNQASRAVSEYAGLLLDQIHNSVTEDTDPGEYLAAILNTGHGGRRIGDEVVARMAPMREQMRQRPIPVGIVGSTMGEVVLGHSAGDIIVRRRHEYEEGFDTKSGVRLAVPLDHISTTGLALLSNRSWQYRGDYPAAYSVGVTQWLSELRVAGTLDEVRTANDTPHRPFKQNDQIMAHERSVKAATGFVPVLVYGETAVSGLLAALYENRNAESWGHPPTKDDVLAAAISIGLDPEAIADVDVVALKERLHQAFLKRVAQTTWSTIHKEYDRRESPNTAHFAVGWDIDATPQVMHYSDVSEDEVVKAIRAGVKRSFSELRAGDSLDIPSYWHESEDHRLLEEEARELATGVIAVRYGITVEPAQLQSDELAMMFSARLEEKQQEQEQFEQYAREHPWLYPDRVRI